MTGRRKRILVVEDNARLCTVLHAAFCDSYEVVTVASAKTMEEELQQHAYDLVVTDLNLPDGSSDSILRRSDHLMVGHDEIAGLGVPAVVITGLDPEDDQFQKARRLPNVLAIFQKPLDMEEVRAKVDELLQTMPLPCGRLTASGRLLLDPTAHVLVVDCDPEFRTTASRILEEAGFQVRACAEPSETVRLCREHVFHLLLISYLLDEETAEGLLDELHAQLAGRVLPPVLILSELGEALTMDHFRRWPAVKEVLRRSGDPQELRETVQRVVGERA